MQRGGKWHRRISQSLWRQQKEYPHTTVCGVGIVGQLIKKRKGK